ncbi:MAG: RdgB/HAM1 family non-canonical purine NTP pyrophosphatase [Acidobacteriota bacterium]|nr:RdgB/HAM1 family non-canonical purine NTP pyrophosphatase [Acidobacteriota bacterium]
MDSVKWLLATRNPGKIRELRIILADARIDIVGLGDLGIDEESPESGKTFLENAMQKARFYYERAGIPTLSDDSGLEVDALNGAPGIHSARFGGFKTHEEKCAYLLGLLAEVPKELRTARFVCAAVFHDGHEYISAEGSLEGFIGDRPVGDLGFGYDPVFHPEQDGPSTAEYGTEAKNAISHRGRAFRALVKGLEEAGRLP